MPYVDVRITPSATREEKRALVKGVTRLLADILGKRPEHTQVVINELAEANWGYAGLLTDEYRVRGPCPDK